MAAAPDNKTDLQLFLDQVIDRFHLNASGYDLFFSGRFGQSKAILVAGAEGIGERITEYVMAAKFNVAARSCVGMTSAILKEAYEAAANYQPTVLLITDAEILTEGFIDEIEELMKQGQADAEQVVVICATEKMQVIPVLVANRLSIEQFEGARKI